MKERKGVTGAGHILEILRTRFGCSLDMKDKGEGVTDLWKAVLTGLRDNMRYREVRRRSCFKCLVCDFDFVCIVAMCQQTRRLHIKF